MGTETDPVGVYRAIATTIVQLVCAAMLSAGIGCNATLSLFPVYGNEGGVVEPRVVGQWRGESGERDAVPFHVTVVPSKAGGYRLTLSEEPSPGHKATHFGLPADFCMRVVKIGDQLYLDVTPRRVLDLNAPEQYNPLLVPGHLILACSFGENSISLRAISAHRLRDVAKRDGTEVPMLVQGDANPVLAVPTEKLRALILKYADAIFTERPFVLRLAKAQLRK